MHKILFRPIIVLSLVLGLTAMIELFALGSLTWRNLNRIDRIKNDVNQGHELEQLMFDLVKMPSLVAQKNRPNEAKKNEIHEEISNFIEKSRLEEKQTTLLLDNIKTLLLNVEQGHRQDIDQVLTLSQSLLNLQREEEEKLLNQIYRDSRIELNFAVIIPIAIILPAFLLGLVYFRKRILLPLVSLEHLLKRLIAGEMKPINESKNDLLMQPLYDSYNRLIKRLVELEAEHLNHTQTLEHEVRNATHALLEQSHSLARSERLAAVGELAASAAHELRNPLAGIQAALENISRESQDPDQVDRLQLVCSEVKRLSHNLSDLLAFSRQPPKDPVHVNVAKLIHELITLLRYQIEENIALNCSIPDKLETWLPENELRQALLNLILNSIQELGTEEGEVQVNANQYEGNLVIEVKDTGPGFPKQLIEQGIRPFISYHEQGTGLGLSMVLRFARSIGGQLQLRNDEQGHACAKLILPIRS